MENQRRAVPDSRVIQQPLEDLSLSLSTEHRLSDQPCDHIRTLAAPGAFVVRGELLVSWGPD